jgi:DnaK suppressor protein
MNKSELRRFERLLTQLREQIVGEGDAAVEPNRVDGAEDLDEDAKALNEMNQIIASRQNKSRTASLARIDAALRRLRSEPEDFGLCLECEEPIADKRLTLMPFSEYCVSCQGKRDAPRGTARRRLTDFVE